MVVTRIYLFGGGGRTLDYFKIGCRYIINSRQTFVSEHVLEVFQP